MPDITHDVLANVPAIVSVAFVKSIDGSVTTRDRIVVNVYLEDLALAEYEGKIGHTGQVVIKSAAIGDIVTSYEAKDPGIANLNQPPVPDNDTFWQDLGTITVGAADWDSKTTYVPGNIVQCPANREQLEDLAIQLATDYYLWKLASLELRLASYVLLDGDGGHDLEFWHDDPQTVIHRSGWEPDTGEFFHSGSNGSFTDEVTIITDPATGTATGPQFTVVPTNGLTASAEESSLTLGFGGEPYSVIWTESDESPQFTPDVLSFDGYTFSAKASVYFDIQNNTYTLEDAATGDVYQIAQDNLMDLMNSNVFIEMSNGGQGLAVNAHSNVFVGKSRTPTSTTGFMYYSYGTAVPTGIPLSGSSGFGALYIDASDNGRSWWIYTTTGWLRLAKDALTVINVTNIFDYTFIENTIVFNEFNQTINIKYGDTIYNFYADCCEGRQYYCMSKDAVQNCYNLLTSEYALMIIDGFAYVSGPHATKVACLSSCSSVPTAWWCIECDGVSACLELTEAELNVAIFTDGCTPISKHLNQAACLAVCDIPANITTACCVETIPQTLIGTVTAKTGGCACMPDRMIFTYQGGDRWTGSTITTCDNNGFLHLDCTGGVWTLGNASVGTSTLTSLDCDPLQIVFAVTGDASTCTGTYTVTITE